MKEKRTFIIIWFACLMGSWLLIPYILHMGILPSSFSPIELFFVTTIQTSFIYGVALVMSYFLIPKTDLNPFVALPLEKVMKLGIFMGIGIGGMIWLLDKIIFKTSLLTAFHPPAGTGFLASFYGGINEEVLLRLCLFTLIYFLFGKVIKNRTALFWSTNVLVALLFGIGHLPVALQMTPPTFLEVSRILVLNGIPGLFFGWLYATNGFFAAAIAHFVTDLFLHLFLV